MTAKFVETHQIIPSFMPVDLQAGANTGDYINLENYDSAVFILLASVGTAGDDPVVTVNQAQDNSGTGVKTCAKVTEVWHKVGATAVSAVGTFTEATQSAAATYDTAGIDGAENQMVLVIEIDADQLDTNNGFTHIQFSVADVGSNAQLGAGLVILKGARYPQATLTTAID